MAEQLSLYQSATQSEEQSQQLSAVRDKAQALAEGSKVSVYSLAAVVVELIDALAGKKQDAAQGSQVQSQADTEGTSASGVSGSGRGRRGRQSSDQGETHASGVQEGQVQGEEQPKQEDVPF